MIKFHKVTKIYPPDVVALKEVSFHIKPQEFVSITGRSGAGKTTLLKLLLGHEDITEGKILFAGADMAGLNKKELMQVRRNVGTVFQDYKLLSAKTVYENLAYIMEVMGCQTSQIQEDVPQVLEIVGLSKKAGCFPDQLSSGEMQRAAIARAFIHRPEVILADEPTGNLDPYCSRDVISLLCKINEMGTTVLLATHSKEIVNGLKRRVITLEQGSIIRDEETGRFIL